MQAWAPLSQCCTLSQLADASSQLRHLQQLSLVQRPVGPLQAGPCAADDRPAFTFSKVRKSMLPPDAFNRFASEVYPLAATRVDFIIGSNSRLVGRDPRVTWA
jgi:hypothetical protein